tara:strand:+ start:206487 stop:206618 length:132 start_codon:yes stop_codon:yes gene_type:complete
MLGSKINKNPHSVKQKTFGAKTINTKKNKPFSSLDIRLFTFYI